MAEDLSGYLAGLVLSCEEVPKKDKLKKLSIDVGAAEPVDVVTNAGNVGTRTVGCRVVVAAVGSELRDPEKVKKTSVGGVSSTGVLCDGPMLGWSGGGAGTAVLLPDAFNPGDPCPRSGPRLDGAAAASPAAAPVAKSTGPGVDSLFEKKLSKEEKAALAAKRARRGRQGGWRGRARRRRRAVTARGSALRTPGVIIDRSTRKKKFTKKKQPHVAAVAAVQRRAGGSSRVAAPTWYSSTPNASCVPPPAGTRTTAARRAGPGTGPAPRAVAAARDDVFLVRLRVAGFRFGARVLGSRAQASDPSRRAGDASRSHLQRVSRAARGAPRVHVAHVLQGPSLDQLSRARTDRLRLLHGVRREHEGDARGFGRARQRAPQPARARGSIPVDGSSSSTHAGSPISAIATRQARLFQPRRLGGQSRAFRARPTAAAAPRRPRTPATASSSSPRSAP